MDTLSANTTKRIRRGKLIDSGELKRNLNKRASVAAARQASLCTRPGPPLSHCPICAGSRHHPLVEIYGYTYHECGNCGVVFVCNMPTESELTRLYASECYSQSAAALLTNDQVLNYRIAHVARPKVDYVLERIRPRRRAWLDIGCGTGEVLSVLKEYGWLVKGLECNAHERTCARRRFGLDVDDAFLTRDNAVACAGDFEVISLFGVLEHLTDPHAIVQMLGAAQCAGGYLVIEVPHYPSVSAYSQLAFPDMVNRIMHPPLHLYLFALKSLTHLLGAHGYEITDAWLYGQDMYEVWSTLGLVVDALDGSRLADAMAAMLAAFQQSVDQAGLSDEVLVIATRR
jgi:SAM-dependent methyltransferase